MLKINKEHGALNMRCLISMAVLFLMMWGPYQAFAYSPDNLCTDLYNHLRHHGSHGSDKGRGVNIPFVAGSPITLTTTPSGDVGTMTMISFGYSQGGIVPYPDGSIVINFLPYNGVAFSMPRDGILTSLAAYFSFVSIKGPITARITVQAQVYVSPTPNEVFYPLEDAIVTLSSNAPDVVSGLISNLNIPIQAGTRVAVVFSTTATNTEDEAVTITGNASAGLTIR